jgi:hypothetical protein
MGAIRRGEADVVVLDAGDVYRAGFLYGLVPVVAEVYNLGDPFYYVVAVAKQRDNSSELVYLKTKNTCHTVTSKFEPRVPLDRFKAPSLFRPWATRRAGSFPWRG